MALQRWTRGLSSSTWPRWGKLAATSPTQSSARRTSLVPKSRRPSWPRLPSRCSRRPPWTSWCSVPRLRFGAPRRSTGCRSSWRSTLASSRTWVSPQDAGSRQPPRARPRRRARLALARRAGRPWRLMPPALRRQSPQERASQRHRGRTARPPARRQPRAPRPPCQRTPAAPASRPRRAPTAAAAGWQRSRPGPARLLRSRPPTAPRRRRRRAARK
mmetsp:Transcript_36563/g.104562  ORF Transcript_36563/g.104562 Transcript_36563/m.104562 type:complete len:216 (-) Transcript_36563:21-668(-)